MNCQKCGVSNMSGEKFCKNCGCILESVSQQQVSSQPQQLVSQQPQEQPYVQTNMNTNNAQNRNENLNSDYVQQTIAQNMKKWAILSVVVPIVGMIWYWFIGLSFYLAIIIATTGLIFAKKGEMANKKLARIGRVLNGMLFTMAIIMLILQIMVVFE